MTFTPTTDHRHEVAPARLQAPGAVAHKDRTLMSNQHGTDHLGDDDLRALLDGDRRAARVEAMTRAAEMCISFARSWWVTAEESREWSQAAFECLQDAIEGAPDAPEWMSDLLTTYAPDAMDPDLAFWSAAVHLVTRHDGPALTPHTRALRDAIERAANAHLGESS